MLPRLQLAGEDARDFDAELINDGDFGVAARLGREGDGGGLDGGIGIRAESASGFGTFRLMHCALNSEIGKRAAPDTIIVTACCTITSCKEIFSSYCKLLNISTAP